MIAAPAALAQTRTRGEPPVFPQELLEADLLGISLGMDPALVPALLLAGGFEPDPNIAAHSTAPEAMELHYRRGDSANLRPGESFDYFDVVTTTERPGSAPFVRHRREIHYWRTYPAPGVSGGPGRWEDNPDADWARPLYDQICAYQAQSSRNPCNETEVALTTRTGAVSLRLDAYSTEVRLSGAPDVVR